MHANRLFVLSIVIVSLFTIASPAPAKHRAALPSTGLRAIAYAKAPPDFTFDLGRGPRRLSALAGKPVVLNFWAAWCAPCRDEFPAFSQMQASYGDAVGLLTLSEDAPGAARAFLTAHELQLPLVEDPGRAVFSAYSIEEVPVTIVLGRDGTVSHVSVGQLDWAELRDAVERALGPAAGP
jgi:cytochrome c biogenesis protein CcmG/thiol:disulfide interchange protein DsbE